MSFEGHAGRPGERGGSLPKGMSASDLSKKHASFIANTIRDKLTKDQISLTKDYVAEGDNVNLALRNDKHYGTTDQIVSGMDAAFSASPGLEQDARLYRITESTIGYPPEGSQFTDKGYTSTTYSNDEYTFKRICEDTANDNPRYVTIDVPSGTKVVSMRDGLGMTSDPEWIDDYKEIVLPRGSTFEVLQKDDSTIHLRLIK